MKIRVPEYYKDFECIGGECIDTCCAGWEVDVDKKSSAYYKSVEGEFGDRLRSMLVDYPVEDRFILQENARCPFLNNKNLCDIYSELGRDKLCETCTNFPRHITEFGNTREIGISLSCPVAAELIMKRTQPISFEVSETEEKINGYNDIDANLYYNLCSAREIAYNICQNRNMPVNHRAVLFLDFSASLQKKLKSSNLAKVIADYKDETFIKGRLNKLIKKYSGYKRTDTSIKEWLDTYKSLEHIKKEWPVMLSDAEEYIKKGMPNIRKSVILIHKRDYEYEHLLVYYIYRYFLRTVFDGRLFEKAQLACVALIMQELSGVVFYDKNNEFSFYDQITIMRIYSKETEHSEENLEELYTQFHKKKAFSYKSIMGILLGSNLGA